MGPGPLAPTRSRTARREAIGLLVALLLGAPACTGALSDNDPSVMGGAGSDGIGGKAGGSAGKGGSSGVSGNGGATGGSGGKTVVVDPNNESAGPLPMRRLTRREYNNTIAALLGDTSNPADALPADTLNEAGFLAPRDVSTLEARIYFDAADGIAARAVKTLTRILPCDYTKVPEADCARQFVQRFGRRAYRRPLTEAEVTGLFGLYDGARKLGLDFPAGIKLVLQAMLQSPKLIYRWEIAPDVKAQREGNLVRLTPHQVASRLSYFLWAGPPDDALLDAADAGKLGTPAEIKAQVARMLADKNAAGAIAEFHRQWTHLQIAGGIDSLQKSPQKFPTYNDDVRAQMKNSFDAFTASVFLDDKADHTIKGLLTAPVAYVNAKTAPLFGLTGVTGSEVVRKELDPTQRAGLFTQPAFLAVHATTSESHPTRRGAVIWRDLICGEVGQVPAVVPSVKQTPGLTTRQRFEEHDKEPCAVCHTFLDPPGFALENYDALGQYRAKDGTADVNASDDLTLPSGKKLSFKNGVELMKQLADEKEVGACIARQWYRYALGRMDEPADATSIARGYGTVMTAGGDLREVLFAAATSKTFLYRTSEQGEP